MAAGLIYLVADIRRRLGPDLGPLVPNDGLAVGAIAPVIEGTDARSGAPRTWRHTPGRPAVVAFLSPTCPPCEGLSPHLDRLARSRRGVPVVAVVLPGQGVDYGRRLTTSITVIRDDTGAAQKAFAVARTPLVFAVAPDGTVAMRTVSNDLIALEDTLDGFGQAQGSRPWLPAEEQGNEG